jgi:predicted nucleic acid-binding protein
VRLVCDTNVLIAGLVADGLCRDIVKRRLPRHELFTSNVLLAELNKKLRDKFGVDPASVPFINSYREQATIIQPAALPDKDLLTLKSYVGIPILSPRQFVELLDRAG